MKIRWFLALCALILPTVASATERQVYPLRPEVNMPYQPKTTTSHKNTTGPSNATATATANPRINVNVYVGGARTAAGPQGACQSPACQRPACVNIARSRSDCRTSRKCPSRAGSNCPLPPERVAACGRLGGNLTVGRDGVNLWCVDPQGRRLSPTGAIIGFAR